MFMTNLSRPCIYLASVFVMTTMVANLCRAQEVEEKEETFRPHHLLALVVSHAHVFEGRDADGKISVLALPAWGLDYTYAFRPRWGIGLHTDLIIEKFKVEKNLGDGEEIERSFPVAPAIVGVYKPGRHWSLLLGMGGEFAKEENFALTRAGVEYSAELPGGWEILGTIAYDFRWNAYDTWTLGIGIAKAFGE